MRTTIITSLVLCAVEFLTIVLAGPMARPILVLRFLPEDIRAAAKDHPDPPKWKQMIAHILLGMFLLTFIGGILFLGIRRAEAFRNGSDIAIFLLRPQFTVMRSRKRRSAPVMQSPMCSGLRKRSRRRTQIRQNKGQIKDKTVSPQNRESPKRRICVSFGVH